MVVQGKERDLIRDALAAFTVGVPAYDELREAIVRRIDAEAEAENDDGA